MGRPSDIYVGDTDGIMPDYKDTINNLTQSEDIQKIVDYLKSKEKTRNGLTGGEDEVLTYAESKLKSIGGGRRSKKRPTARRRRSSKARKARKARKTRTTRRKY